jgi:hypothetical protein
VLPALAKLFFDVPDAPAPFPNFSLFTSKLADVLLDDAPALVAEPDCEDKLRLVGASEHVMGPDCEDGFILIEIPSPCAKPNRDVKFKLIGTFSSMLVEPECDVIFNLGEMPRPMLIEPDCEVIHCLADAPSPLLIEPDCEVKHSLADPSSSLLIERHPSSSSDSLSPPC